MSEEIVYGDLESLFVVLRPKKLNSCLETADITVSLLEFCLLSVPERPTAQSSYADSSFIPVITIIGKLFCPMCLRLCMFFFFFPYEFGRLIISLGVFARCDNNMIFVFDAA